MTTKDATISEYSIPPCLTGCFRIPRNGRLRIVELVVNSCIDSLHPLVAYHLPMALYMRRLQLLCCNGEEERRAEVACESMVPAALLYAPDKIQGRRLLDGIRRNGSLHELVLDEDTEREMLTPAITRKVQAHLTRNREVPRLLSRPYIGGSGSEKDDAYDTKAASPAETDLTCFPPLMVAATLAPAMSPTNVLIGLAAASMAERMGEFRLGGAKRKRSCSSPS